MDQPRTPTAPPPSGRDGFVAEILSALRNPAGLVWLFAPFVLLLCLFGLYGLYWSSAAGRMEREIANWFEARRTAGYSADYESLSFGGFPFRLEADLRSPRIGAPDTPSAWSVEAGRVLINALPYNPNHLILRVPSTVAYGFDPVAGGRARADERRIYEIASKTLRASARAESGRLARLSIEGDLMTAVGERRFYDGETAPLGTLVLSHGEIHAREAIGDDGRPAADLAVTLTGLDWPGAAEGEGPLPTDVERLAFAGRFTALPDPGRLWSGDISLPDAAAEWAGAEGRLALSAFDIVWGPVDIASAGDLGIAAIGTPDGRLEARVKGLDELIDRMESAGRLDARQAGAYRGLLKTLKDNQGTDDDGRMAVPVALQGGQIYVGPAPVAALPVLFPPRP